MMGRHGHPRPPRCAPFLLVEGDEEVRAGVPQRQVHLVLVHLLLRRLNRCGVAGHGCGQVGGWVDQAGRRPR